MLKLIPDLPDHVVGITASGHVTGDDYESVLVPAVEDKLSRNKKLNCLYNMDEDFEGFTAGALWDDAKVGMKHPLSWHRLACVTDKEWIAKSAKAFGCLWPGHMRVFKDSALEEATAWVSEAD
jgi:hypothetical protein